MYFHILTNGKTQLFISISSTYGRPIILAKQIIWNHICPIYGKSTLWSYDVLVCETNPNLYSVGAYLCQCRLTVSWYVLLN
jgi:hypothetical protein